MRLNGPDGILWKVLGQARKGQTTTWKKKYHGVEGPRDYRDRLKRSKHTEEEEEEEGERATDRAKAEKSP